MLRSTSVEAQEFPDLARRYQVSGVPKTVVNEEVEIMGGLPQDAFIQQALSTLKSQVSTLIPPES